MYLISAALLWRPRNNETVTAPKNMLNLFVFQKKKKLQRLKKKKNPYLLHMQNHLEIIRKVIYVSKSQQYISITLWSYSQKYIYTHCCC